MSDGGRVGVLLVPATLGDGPLDPSRLPALAVAAERAALDRVGVSDHLLHPAPCWDPVACLGALASVTEHVRLATQVLILPLRHPLQVAQSFATLDALSGGRVELGVGVGGEWPVEYEALGLQVHERGRLADRSLASLLALWRGQSLRTEGEGHSGEVRLPVRPVQMPHPPIVVGGRSPAALERAARVADRWDGIFLDAAQYRRRAGRLAEAAAERGRHVGTGLVAWAHVGPRRQAHEELSGLLESFYRAPFAQIERFCLYGSLEDCEERGAELAAAGTHDLTLIPAGRRDPFEQIEALGELAKRLRPLEQARPAAPAPSLAGVGVTSRQRQD